MTPEQESTVAELRSRVGYFDRTDANEDDSTTFISITQARHLLAALDERETQ
jgi:hypothetical protein